MSFELSTTCCTHRWHRSCLWDCTMLLQSFAISNAHLLHRDKSIIAPNWHSILLRISLVAVLTILHFCSKAATGQQKAFLFPDMMAACVLDMQSSCHGFACNSCVVLIDKQQRQNATSPVVCVRCRLVKHLLKTRL